MLLRCFRLLAALPLIAGLLLLAACGGGTEGGSTGSGSGGPVASVRIDPAVRSLAVGETGTFRAEALDAAGNVLSGKTFSFSSSSPSVATVAIPIANPTSVTAVAEGATLIRATTDGKTGTANLTVGGQPDIRVSGRVVDGQTNTGLGGVMIQYADAGSVSASTVSTAADGSYSFTVPFSRPFEADLTASLSGYVQTRLRSTIEAPSTSLQLEPILLVRAGGPSTISGRVLNATSGEPIAGASVSASPGQSIIQFSLAGSTTSNAQGEYSLAGIPAGTYNIRTAAVGFQTCNRTVVSVGPPAVANQDVFCAPTGDGNAQTIRIVLSWGQEPADLDAHLTGPNADASRFHIYFSSRESATAKLDRDNTNSFGPETVTITQTNSGDYRYSVHDYTNRGSASSTALARSGAKVDVYTVDSTTTYYVPNQPGNLWTVFEITGLGTGRPQFNPINRMGAEQTASAIQ
ncbi:MAG: carboxypeptidase regulatory-like domain-containing protein [Lautropia sp.]